MILVQSFLVAAWGIIQKSVARLYGVSWKYNFTVHFLFCGHGNCPGGIPVRVSGSGVTNGRRYPQDSYTYINHWGGHTADYYRRGRLYSLFSSQEPGLPAGPENAQVRVLPL